jgi:pilus assembly protein CpaE
MDEALNALCLSPDPAVSRAVVIMLAGLPGFAVNVREIDYGQPVDFETLRNPDLAIVVLGTDLAAGLAMIDEVHRAVPATQVLALAPEERPETIIKAMRAGADEFLPLPLDATSLLKVCIKVSALRGSAAARPRGACWVAYGAKGGVGVTTLVANLGFALRAAQREVALVDLDVFRGDLALFLNVTPGYSLRDLANNFKQLDEVYLQSTLIRHRSALALTREQTLRIIEMLDATHEVTVVDATSVPLESTLAALGCADRIFLVTELTLPALRACMRTLDWLRAEDIDPDTVEMVVNKYASRSWEVAPGEAAKTLRLPIRTLIPRDEAAAFTAINSGLPLEQVRGGGAVQRAIAALVPRTPVDNEKPAPKGFRRFFSGAERRV